MKKILLYIIYQQHVSDLMEESFTFDDRLFKKRVGIVNHLGNVYPNHQLEYQPINK